MYTVLRQGNLRPTGIVLPYFRGLVPYTGSQLTTHVVSHNRLPKIPWIDDRQGKREVKVRHEATAKTKLKQDIYKTTQTVFDISRIITGIIFFGILLKTCLGLVYSITQNTITSSIGIFSRGYSMHTTLHA